MLMHSDMDTVPARMGRGLATGSRYMYNVRAGRSGAATPEGVLTMVPWYGAVA